MVGFDCVTICPLQALLDNLDTGEKEEMTRIERAEAVEFLYIIRAQCAHKLKRNLRRALSSDENTTETKEAVTSAASPTPGFFGRMYKRFTGSLPSENKTSLTIAGQNLELSEEDVAALRNFSEQIVDTEKLVEAEPAFVQFQACIKISEVSVQRQTGNNTDGDGSVYRKKVQHCLTYTITYANRFLSRFWMQRRRHSSNNLFIDRS